MLVRQALLEDANAITGVYCALIERWTRRAGDGTSTEAEYDELSLFERWQHGGPWYSVETCAVWLGHLLQDSDGIPLVAELDGDIVGQAEVFIGQEAEPHGHHINISTLCVRPDAQGQGAGRALVNYVERMADVLGCPQVTVAYPQPPEFYESLGYEAQITRHYLTLTAESGRVFYKARDLTDDTPQQIQDWFMPLGRFQNAREEWERMRWRIWKGVPQLVEANWHRLFIDLTGQPGLLHLHQHDANHEAVTARLWTQRPVSSHMISAVRDRASRLGYSQITTLVESDVRPLLPDAEDDGKVQRLYAKRL